LKIVPKNNVFSDRSLRTLINQEISICNKVKHSFNYLVNFYEFFYTRNLAVFVYEYYEYGTFQNMFINDKMSLLEVILLMKDLFNGLEELKHMKIIHKNLNPECVYISNNKLKIGGFEYCELNDCHKRDEFDHN
jgi:serine/threonine-protein kinase ULK2